MLDFLLRHKFFLFVCLLSITVAILAVARWFSGGHVMYFWDSYLPFDSKNSFEHLYYLWRERLFPGYASSAWSWFIYWGILFLPELVIHSPSLALSIGQFSVYVFLLSFSVIGFYSLAINILETLFKPSSNKLLLKIAALVCAVLYTFNIFTFFNFYFMFNPGAFLLSFLPLNILALIKIYPLDGGEVKNRFLWTLVFFITLFGMSPGLGVYVLFLQYLIWLTFYVVFFVLLLGRKIKSKKTLEILLFFFLIILFNFWWFIPAFSIIGESYSGQSSFGTDFWFKRGYEPSQLLNVTRLLGSGLMASNKFSWSPLLESSNLFTLPLFIFPFLMVFALVRLAKNRLSNIMIFLLGMTLVSLFIAKFSNPPFAWIMGFAFNYVPFFGAFRDAFQKAGVYFIPGYFIFISVGLVFFVNMLLKKKTKVVLYSFIAIFAAAFLVLSGPFFLFGGDNIRKEKFNLEGKEYTISSKTKVPPEYYSLKEFLEKRCKGKSIANLPRSGFVSDAIWEKYNTSYAGQDILPSLISCNFLSTAMFNGGAESALQSPYLHLQREDLGAFKNNLKQSGIQYVLVRYDFAPFGLVKWTHVDPARAEKMFLSDGDFKKIYDDDFFSLFEYKEDLGNHGFHLTSDVVYTQSNLASGVDYLVLSKSIGDIRQPVIFNRKLDAEKFKDKITLYTTVANCIGCDKIDPKEAFKGNIGKLAMIKRFIKTKVLKRESNLPVEIQISLNIISANESYAKIVDSINNKNQKEFSKNVDEYIGKWREIKTSFESYKGGPFEKNNKLIEINNFISLEKNSTFSHISGLFRDDQFLSTPVNRQKMIRMLRYQEELHNYFSKGIVQTDYSKNLLVARLDVSVKGRYACEALPVRNNLIIREILIDNQDFELRRQLEGGLNYFVEGSYLAQIHFDTIKVKSIEEISHSPGKVKELRLGKFEPGLYKLSFDSLTGSGGKTMIAISQRRIKEDTLKHLASVVTIDDNIPLIDIVDRDVASTLKHEKNFTIDLPSSRDYYLYLYSLNSEGTEVNIKDLAIKTAIRSDDIQLVCATKLKNTDKDGKDLIVTRHSPVRYSIDLPRGYKGFLSFNQTYSSDWEAYDNTGRTFPHYASGYSNAWFIDGASDDKITIKFKRHGNVEKLGIVSIIATIIMFMIYLRLWKK